MNRLSFLTIAGLAALLAVQSAFAQQAIALKPPAYGSSSFEQRKTYQEQALALGGTKRQHNEINRNVFESKYGERGVANIFGGKFPGLNASGINQTIRLGTSDNPNQAKGHLREYIYANAFDRGGEFRVLATGKKLGPEFDGTDIDNYLQHIKTGIKVAVESKEVKLENQNLDVYKTKVLRLAAYSKSTGEPFGFINRHGFKPEIRQFIEQNWGFVFGNVATGKLSGQKPGNTRFRDMEKVLSQSLNLKAESSLYGGGGEIGIGIWMLSQSAPETLADLENVLNPETRDTQNFLRLGEHGTMSLAAISGITAGTARVIGNSKLASNVRTLNGLGMVSKWGGRAGLALFGVSEVFIITQWKTGGLNDRQFYTIQSSLGGGLAGGVVGAEAGAAAGAAIGVWFFGAGAVPGAAIGGVVGGLAGGFGGAKLGEMAATSHYSKLDENQKRQVEASIYQHYGVTR